MTAAPNKLIETTWSSAISFIKVEGNKRMAIPIAYVYLYARKLSSPSSNQVVFTNPKAVLLQTFIKMTIRKKPFIKMARHMR